MALQDIKVAAKADTLYYVGDNTSYKNPQIAKATATILDKHSVWNLCFSTRSRMMVTLMFSIGMVDAARKIAKENVEAIKATGAKRVVVSDARKLNRMIKVDYPKLLDIATA